MKTSVEVLQLENECSELRRWSTWTKLCSYDERNLRQWPALVAQILDSFVAGCWLLAALNIIRSETKQVQHSLPWEFGDCDSPTSSIIVGHRSFGWSGANEKTFFAWGNSVVNCSSTRLRHYLLRKPPQEPYSNLLQTTMTHIYRFDSSFCLRHSVLIENSWLSILIPWLTASRLRSNQLRQHFLETLVVCHLCYPRKVPIPATSRKAHVAGKMLISPSLPNATLECPVGDEFVVNPVGCFQGTLDISSW